MSQLYHIFRFFNGHINVSILHISVLLLVTITLLYVCFKIKKDLSLSNSLLKEECQKLRAKNKELGLEAQDISSNMNDKLHKKDFQISELNKTIKELSQTIAEYQQKCEEQKKKVISLTAKIKSRDIKIKRLDHSLSEAMDTYNKIKYENESLVQYSHTIEEKNADYEARLVESQNHLKKRNELSEQLKGKIESLSTSLEKSRKQCENLQGELDKLKNSHSKNDPEANLFERLAIW